MFGTMSQSFMKIVVVVFELCHYAPLEFFFQEQSYSSLHSGRSLALAPFRTAEFNSIQDGDIDDPCGAIADFCGVISDPWALSRSTRRSAARGRRCGDADR